ncbi:MAG: oligosaccharide flippase family protein [Ideonella sp.]|nr:oligosaccharide flippase family protein [Ideonella sp.]MCC7456895.1 oligosaccharide flippase family protein [Nitrospira sp.]
MSIRRNILANTASQLYAALIGVLLVPWYVHYLGVEAYGLVGFYTMAQGWFMLLDLGLTPAISREAARFAAGAIDAFALRRLLRALEGVFLAVAVVGALALMAGAQGIASRWLHLQYLDPSEVTRALVLMAAVVSLRWFCGLYRGVIGGFERIVWLSGFNVSIATLRFVLVIPFLAFVGSTPTHYFAYQFGAAVVELLWLWRHTNRLLPRSESGQPIRWGWDPVRGVLRFALSAALTGAIWVLVTQTDKLLLSGLVPLDEYAYFTLAVLAASGILLLYAPVVAAVQPRLTRLSARGDEEGVVRLYRSTTQLVVVMLAPLVALLALFPSQVLLAWTGSIEVAQHAGPLLALYALGNGTLVLAGLPYLLQVARGDLTLHVAGNIGFVLLFLPLLLGAVDRYGTTGAGIAWVAAHLLPFVAWLPYVHHRFLGVHHLSWLSRDIAAIAVPVTMAAVASSLWVAWPQDRASTVILLLLHYPCLTALAVFSSSAARSRLGSSMGLRGA